MWKIVAKKKWPQLQLKYQLRKHHKPQCGRAANAVEECNLKHLIQNITNRNVAAANAVEECNLKHLIQNITNAVEECNLKPFMSLHQTA